MIAGPLKFTEAMSVTQAQGQNILLVEFTPLNGSLKTRQNLATLLPSSNLQFMVTENTCCLNSRWFLYLELT